MLTIYCSGVPDLLDWVGTLIGWVSAARLECPVCLLYTTAIESYLLSLQLHIDIGQERENEPYALASHIVCLQ